MGSFVWKFVLLGAGRGKRPLVGATQRGIEVRFGGRRDFAIFGLSSLCWDLSVGLEYV